MTTGLYTKCYFFFHKSAHISIVVLDYQLCIHWSTLSPWLVTAFLRVLLSDSMLTI